MKTLAATLAALFFVVSMANAQSFAEIEKDGAASAKILFEKSWGDLDGWFVYSQTQKNWAQAYIGFYVKPASWAKFSMGFGAETARTPRFATSILVRNDSISSFTLYEEGGSGKWYKHESAVDLGRVNAGMFSQKFVGTGPFIEVPLPHKFSIAGGVGYGYGKAKPIISLLKNF